MGMARYGSAVIGGLGLLAGCIEAPGALRIVGPDGTQMLHVHCGSEQAACFQIAGERCRHGYDLSPILDAHDGNFLVRCRNPALARSLSAAGPEVVRSTVSARPRAVEDGWPPAEVAMPAEPWPVPSSSTSRPTPRGPTSTVELGY